jgi:hypothetical protein
MESMSISFGDPTAQQTFANEYAEFLQEYQHLMEVTKAIMLNRIISPDIQNEADAVAHLPEEDPRVLAVEDKYKANIASFILARLAIDEFSEMLVLASNGFGLGALKLLRSMYEKVVTSAYVAQHPEVSRSFVDSTWTHKWSLWRRLRKLHPSAESGIDPRLIADLESNAAEAQSRLNESICTKCKQIVSVHAWTKVTLLTMAEDVGTSLSDLYAVAYQVPTSVAHATGESVNSKMEQTADGSWTYRVESSREREHALCAGHNLLLQVLGRQNDHFGYDLEDLLTPRAEAFKRIWSDRRSTVGATGAV